jgi:Flp pilus assembly protein TadG
MNRPSDRAAKRRIGSFLGRLARDTGGNTLALAAAFAIPLAALAGSAVDMSRVYLVKVRLQQACDAGVLAGRKVMTQTTGTTLETAPENAAQAFFKNNLPSTWMGTSGRALTTGRLANGQVTGTAQVTVPMAIMGMFGVGAMTQTVNCSARLDIGDSDIMFVLDVTGSMGCDTGSGCSSTATWTRGDGTTGYYIAEESGSKISALRSAVKLFRTTLETSKPAASHIRYGFVPYSSSVNVGKLIMDKSAGYIANTNIYPSRELADDVNSSTLPTSANTANYNVTNNSTPGRYYEGDVIYGSTSSTPTAAQIATVTLPNTDPYGVAAANTKAGCLQQEVRISGTTKYAKGTFPTSGAVTRKFPVWTPATTSPVAAAICKTYSWTVKPYWRYTNVTQDVSTFKSTYGSGVAGITDPTKITGATTKWQGCIEERDTTASTTTSTIDTTALKDLNPDFVPNSDATRWHPLWPNVIYYRPGTAEAFDYNGSGATATSSDNTSTSAAGSYSNLLLTSAGATSPSLGPTTQYYGCSAPARRLAEMTSGDFDSYLDVTSTSGDFRAFGHTYHDVGLIWGLRLISPDGIWKDDTAAWPGNNAPNRYIVFMTDGLMDPDPSSYNLYGLNTYQTRSAAAGTSDTNLATIHNNRFQAVCNAAKAKNITIFVVAFDVGSTVPANLESCASPGYAYAAIANVADSDSRSLKSAFSRIALQIARLRLQQ